MLQLVKNALLPDHRDAHERLDIDSMQDDDHGAALS